MVIACLLYTILFYERFHRNALLLDSRETYTIFANRKKIQKRIFAFIEKGKK